MKITVLLFAQYREVVGAGEIELELESDATVGDAVETLRGLPGFVALPDAPAVAVNRQYASPDHVLCPDDEVALIPPVAGG